MPPPSRPPQPPSSKPAAAAAAADAILLNFDDTVDHHSYESQSSAPARPPKPDTAGFSLLLDLDDDGPTEHQAPAPTSDNQFDIFTNNSTSSTKSNPTTTTTTKGTGNLLLEFDNFQTSDQPLNSSYPTSTMTTLTPNPQSGTFDPFAALNMPTAAAAPTMKPTNLPFATQRNSSSQSNLQSLNSQKPRDPFGDLFMSGMPANSTGQSQQQTNSATSSQNNLNQASRGGSATPTFQTQPSYQPNYNPPKPNYNIPTPPSATATTPSSSANKPPTAATTKGASFLGEFLPENFTKNAARDKMSLKDMRREIDVKEMDPDKLRVAEWTEGKKANLRALLCSLNTVLWPDEAKWRQVGMHELVTPDDVKKVYRRALLCVHPDKLGAEHASYNLASMIQIELNDAWSRFQSEAGQQNLF
jgi:cyclin G-associated kinase